MAICSMCFQARDVQRVHFGEEQVEVQAQVCRGCRMGIERVQNYILLAGYTIHVVRQPRLFPDELELSQARAKLMTYQQDVARPDPPGGGDGSDRPPPTSPEPPPEAVEAPLEAGGDTKGTPKATKA